MVRDPGAMNRGSSGQVDLSGVRIRGPGPWAVAHGAGAIIVARPAALPAARSASSEQRNDYGT